MASLKNGVLLKLLEDIKIEDNAAIDDDPKPVLLQIRSIIPVLEEGDLWPNRGFFLKVSDSSHTLYVSLSDEQNEMILGNKLKLGQYIYVQKLEKADPVPLLRGVTPVPGRRPCGGSPEDIVSPASLVKLLEASSVDSIVEKGVILEKKISSDSESSRKGRSRSLSASKAHRGEIRAEDIERAGCNVVGGWPMGGWPKSRPSSVDNDSDADSVVSSASTNRISKRRSWNESEILGVKEIFDSSVVKHEIRPLPRSRSANVSPVRSVRYDSSDDNSSSATRRRSLGSVKRVVKNSSKSQVPVPKVNNVQMPSSLCSLIYDKKGAETGISWNSLPSNLVKFGKEVVRQRDVALLAAADALQEACALERLLNSLSILSEFPLAAGDDLQPYVDKFFDLQDDLARTRLIMQSLTSISPLRTQENESCATTNSIKETLNIALERKKNATTWIKSAVAVDLSPTALIDPLTNPMGPTNTLKKTNATGHGNKPKGACIINKKNVDIPFVLASDKEDQPEWTRGSTLSAGADLANTLQDEFGNLFLSYVEKYLDEVERKSLLMESDDRTAEMMYKVKMVSDWLDMIVSNENSEYSGNDAYGRVRSKIYGILLKHVERTCHGF
ncbi:hypothetical protein BUALT_Bualt15G0050400 [Buddleja alternifolia]|uniref:Uncharacterized protein n=1 Tax=Buddleja alternifolia TaxID=168488 RepID=A0AAV6WAS8_9LAMI|nr:hypothetical protein BUALT_Bualt15G0050400 [Buddleja alternifolia]